MKKSIKIVKTFILIFVVGLLLSVVPIKIVSANTEKTVGIIVMTDEGEKCVQAHMTDEQIAVLKKNINDFQGWLEQNNPLSDVKLDISETNQIRIYVDNIIKSLPGNMQLISADEVIKLITPGDNNNWWMNLFIKHSIISVGDSGFSMIPFSQYEFSISLGMSLHKRIYTYYNYNEIKGLTGGFTTFIRVIPPDIGSEKFSGKHIVAVRDLRGLYLNIGDLGFDNRIFGQVVLLGRAYVSAVQL